MVLHEDDWCEHGVLEGGIAWLVEALTVSVLQGGHPLVTRKASMVRHCRRLSHDVHVLFRMHYYIPFPLIDKKPSSIQSFCCNSHKNLQSFFTLIILKEYIQNLTRACKKDGYSEANHILRELQ